MTKLFCADYSAIEVRVLFWLANHIEGLDAYRANRPIYEEMAAAIVRRPLATITKAERDSLGKPTILGCGFQMAWETFQETCAKNGIPISDENAQLAVSTYREVHWPVPKFWENTQTVALAATRTKQRVFVQGEVQWFSNNKFLFCELPSKRRLAYYKPEIKMNCLFECTKCKRRKGASVMLYTCSKCGGKMCRAEWAEPRATLYHWGANPLSKQWELSGTYGGKLVENITQAVARDLMAEAMLRVEEAGYRVVLSVHDELVAENERGSVEEFENLMGQLPAWAKGLPVKVAGWAGQRYRK